MGTRVALVADIDRAIRDIDRAIRDIDRAGGEWERWPELPGNEASRERARREEARLAAMSRAGLIAALTRVIVKDDVARALATLRWRQDHRVLQATWAPLLLLARATVDGTFPRPQQAADGRRLDDLSPAWPLLRARAILTAAPPLSRAPARAGAATT